MCECRNVPFGSYHNQIEIKKIPYHMLAYALDNGMSDTICLDVCIAQEVQDLWNLGITTTGCCCGHNRLPGFIGVIDSDIPKMKAIGYEVAFNPCRPNDEDSFIPTSI